MRILISSDHHVGDQYSCCPASAISTAEDHPRPVALHPWQVYLNKCWDYCRTTIQSMGGVDVTILNGDSINGEEVKSGGHGLTLQKTSDQVSAAAQHFSWIRESSKRLFVIKGTPYHEGAEAQAAEAFAQAISADKWKTGLRTGWWFWKEFNGRVLEATHHMTSGWIYPAGGAGRTGLFSAAAEATGQLPHADIIVRSHNHRRTVALGEFDRDVIFTPAWKLLTPWAAKKMEANRGSLYSHIGMILVEITDKGNVGVDWRTLAFKNYLEGMVDREKADAAETVPDLRTKGRPRSR